MTKASVIVATLIGIVIGLTVEHVLSWQMQLSQCEPVSREIRRNEVVPYNKGNKEEQVQNKETSVSVLLSSDDDNRDELCQKKYILLTTQKSGSTWFCSVLHQQSGISCGGRPSPYDTPESEPVIKYSKLSRRGTIGNVTWQQYQKDLDKAFAEVCEYNPATSIGFKVMYNQIPPQFIEDGRLQTYLGDNGVGIIHLVREAKILNLASAHDARERGKVHHTTNKSEIRETSSLKWNEKVIEHMLELEKLSIEWQDKIHKMTPLVPNFYVSYEYLLGEENRKQVVAQVVSFASGSFDPDITVAEGTLLKQSSSSCSSRIANYTEFRAHDKVISSRSAVACDLIEAVI